MIAFNAEQRILVTGASSGIGYAVASSLNALGAMVIAQGRNLERLEALRSNVTYPERLIPVGIDFIEQIQSLAQWVLGISRTYGKLSGLAFCAGQTWNSPISAWDPDSARHVFDLCCNAPMMVARGFCDRRANIGAGASVVFIATAAGVDPSPGQGMYGAGKAALITGARCLSKEIASRGLRANCISPGLVETPMLDAMVTQLGDPFLAREVPLYPMGLGKVDDVANMTVFLLSDKARWVTGQNIMLLGGRPCSM